MALPPGSKAPFWLQTLEWILHPVEFLETRQQRYGHTFSVPRGKNPPVIYFSRPQDIKEIFTADPNLFDTGRGNKALLKQVFGENGLPGLDGAPHQRQRRLLIPPFHGERLRSCGKIIYEIAEQAISKWEIGQTVPIHTLMQEIALRIILQAVFGLESGQRYEQLQQLLAIYLNSIASPLSACLLFFPWLQQDLGKRSPWGKFVRLREEIDRILYSEIEQRRQYLDPERNDILTLLLMARDEAGQPMTEVELRDQLLTLLAAGHETTTNALTWAMYWIHYLPEVRDKLENELASLSPNRDYSAIARLPYLNAVCQETLRIYPVVMVASNRILNADWEIAGYKLAAGTMLIPATYLTHHREDIYPQPQQFKPERFLEKQFSGFEYLPFGGGNRSCIGMAFAQYEIKLVLAAILQQKQLSLLNPRPLKAARRGFTSAPEIDLKFAVTGEGLGQPQTSSTIAAVR